MYIYLFGVSQTLVSLHFRSIHWSPHLNLKSPSSSRHFPSYPTNAMSLPFSFSVTVLVSPGSSEILSKLRRRMLSGVLLATRSFENRSTLSFPSRPP